jgi:putative oxidoreductase
VSDTARLVSRVLHPRLDRGVPALLLALVRAGTGVFFVSVSIGKFFDHAQEAVDFDRYGVPAPDLAVYAVGVVELVGGLLLVVGLLTRPAALALALTLMGAIATAGRVEGGSFHLGIAPTFLAITLLLTWLGAGRPGLDPVLERRLGAKSAV